MKISKPASLQPTCVLGIVAHPDDLDFGMAGSAAVWSADGVEVWYLILTNGSKGSAKTNLVADKLIATRRQEQEASAQIVGARGVIFLDYEDGALENSYEVRRDIARVIRQIQPDVAVTFDPSALYFQSLGIINHPDHRAAGQAAMDAIYPLARDAHSFPELLAEGLQPHCTPTILLINFDHPNYFVDISDKLDTKLQALDAHASQQQGLSVFRDRLQAVAQECGRQANCTCAEGFIRLEVS